MASAEEIIKKYLDSDGIGNILDKKEPNLKFEVDGCYIELYKHKYAKGHTIVSKCMLDESYKRVESEAEFVTDFVINIDKDSKYFRLHGVSDNSALNAGNIEVIMPIKKIPEETGTWYIKCKDFENECDIEKSQYD